MNQDLELMRNLLLWVADAEIWELAYCQKQVSFYADGSPDRLGMYNIYPGTSLEEGSYEEIWFRTLPSHVYPTPDKESTRDQFLWYGNSALMQPGFEQIKNTFEDGSSKSVLKHYTYLPAGFPLRNYWMERQQFEVSYNLNQLDLAGLLRVRYFHTEEEWSTEPPVSMYLTPKGADFVAYIRDSQRWEDLKSPHTASTTAAAQKKGIFAKILKWKRVTPQVAKAIDDRIQTVSILSNRATQITEFIQGLPMG